MRIFTIFISAAIVQACDAVSPSEPPMVSPVVETAPVPDDPDDPAVWINDTDPARSLILASNKVAAPDGALYVYALDGTVRQVLAPLDRPNNVDVEYGLATPAGTVDIAVVTERLAHRLRVYQVTASGLAPLDGGEGISVLEGQTGEAHEPMGISLYRRPRDGAIFAFVAPKAGPPADYLWQYRLVMNATTGRVQGSLVRRFGNYSGTGEIEAIAVDDELGYVYYADEAYAIRKWHADPEHPDAGRELAVFGRGAFRGHREGLAIAAGPDGGGFIVCSDQQPRATRLRMFPRQGPPGAPHRHDSAGVVVTGADGTDGLEVVSRGLGDPFADGLLVMMNSRGRNFLVYRWADVIAAMPRDRRP